MRKRRDSRFVMLVKWSNLSFSRLSKLRCRLIIAAEVCYGQLILFSIFFFGCFHYPSSIFPLSMGCCAASTLLEWAHILGGADVVSGR